ncbi:phosphatidylinositol-4-phosphate 5-kinase, putative [Theileria equi strain WA]|uniref:Phosphatidylinositol-4-phosphate 5-kinase, putative n=1 Tax=Theileria equi strain WA TaxID=1537102 RepID=L0AVZ3_THEEQ|nr:phosphatidylinositol-4-phosphate 5-kinase, putative [Theileria equi strain WA]AFZ79069.1 phosphatidylinositol-4-phosphate 5-kinase, putative [Theileria equi strain WA]|eukprot:XP_004828735.1 phosphatidylinositol-4-phosphate 5-kinase, putative [Theileria equi strain WA]
MVFPVCGARRVLLPPKIPPDYYARLQEVVQCSKQEAQSIYNRYRMLTPIGHLDLLKFEECLGLLGTLGRLLTERMFLAFDLNGDGGLDFVEFAGGLLIMLDGSEDKKLQLSFRILHNTSKSHEESNSHDKNTSMGFKEFLDLVNDIALTRALLVSKEPVYRSEADVEKIFESHASLCDDGVKRISQGDYINAVCTSSDFLELLGISVSRCAIETSSGYMFRGLDVSKSGNYINRSNVKRSLARNSGKHNIYKWITNNSLQENKRGFSVHFGHESWNDVIDMMIGLSISARHVYNEPEVTLTDEDFDTKLTFTILHDPKLNYLSVRHIYNKNGLYSSRFARANFNENTPMNSGFTSMSTLSYSKIIFKEYAPLVFKEIRSISGLSASDYMDSISPEQIVGNMVLGNLSTMSELVSEGKSGSLFYYTIDGKLIIKTITKRCARFVKQWLRNYYNHLNEHRDSLLTRFYGLFSIQTRGYPYRVYFVVMNNIFYSKVAIHRRYDLKGSWVGRSLADHESSDHTVALKDCDFGRFGDVVYLGANAEQILTILRNDVEFLRLSSILDYSLLLGIHYRNKSVDYFDWESENHNSFHCVMGSKREHLYYIGIIDLLTCWNIGKRAEHFWRILQTRDHYGVSCVHPNFYAKRFMDFVEKHVRSD